MAPFAITNLIDLHERLLAEAVSITEQISQVSLMQDCDIDLVTKMTESRERNVSALTSIQGSIERFFENKDVRELDHAMIEKLRAWDKNMRKKIEMINRIDQVIVQALEEHKKMTTESISDTFQSKEKFRGYNLNNVKK